LIFPGQNASTTITSIPSKFDVFLRGVATDGKGDVFFGDNTNGVIREVIASNGTVTSASQVVMVGSRLTDPQGIAVDGAGDLFVIDNNAVKEIVAVNGILSASSPVITLTTGYSQIVGATLPTGYSQLVGIALDGAGNIFFTDEATGAIYEMAAVNGNVSPSSTVSLIYLLPLNSYNSNPVGIRVDVAGNIFVGAGEFTGNGYLNAYDSGGVVDEILATNGVVSTTSELIPNNPNNSAEGLDLALDAADDVFLTDAITGAVDVSGPATLLPAFVPTVNNPQILQSSGIANDGNGHFYATVVSADNQLYLVQADLSTPPALSFPLTASGSAASQLGYLLNIGNSPLTFEPPASGTNPVVTANFSVGTDPYLGGVLISCPQLSPGANPSMLAAGDVCYDYVTFQATGSAGTVTGQVVTTDTDRNAASPGYSTQTIPLVATVGSSISVAVNPVSVISGTTSTTFTATVTFGGPTPTGALNFELDGTYVGAGTCASSSSTTETCTLSNNPSSLSVGTHTLIATVAADTNYLQTASTITNNLTVTPAAVASTTQGMTAFPDTPFGSTSSPVTVTFTFQAPGTMAAPQVFTTGASGLDFTDAGTGTCTTNGTAHGYAAGGSCTVNVLFTPTAVGHRSGAVVLNASGQNPSSVVNLVGNGTGPMLLYTSNATPTTIASFSDGDTPLSADGGPTLTSPPHGMVIDGRGDLFFSDGVDNTIKMMAATNGAIAPGTPITTLLSGLVSPAAMAIDGAGNLYVVDAGAGVIRKFVATNGVLSSTSPMVVLVDQFSSISGLAVDDGGNIFFTSLSPVGACVLYELVAVNGVVVPNSTPTVISNDVIVNYASSLAINIRVDGAENLYLMTTGGIIRFNATNGSVQPGASTYTYPQSDYFGGDGFLDAAIMPSGDLFVANYNDAFFHYNSGLGLAGENEVLVSTESISAVVSDGHGHLYAEFSSFLPFFSTAGLLDDLPFTTAIQQFDFATPPTLTFPPTQVGSTSAAQSFILQNEGNGELDLNDTTAGLIGITSTGFTPTTVCYGATVVTSPQYVPAQIGCNMSVAFSPAGGQSGTVNGTYTMTDNNLNVSNATQTIPLIGTATSASAPAPTVTTVLTLTNIGSSGTAMSFSAAVASSTTGTINGTVSFYLNGVAIPNGSVTLSAGAATIYTTSLAAGTYNLTATFTPSSGSNFAASTSTAVPVTINPNPATIYLNNVSFLYDGTPHAVTATTVPAGLSYSVTYDGSPTVPSAVGGYRVIATITDPNYSGTVSGTLNILQTAPSATIALGNLSGTYTGYSHAVTATTTPAGLQVLLTVGGIINYAPQNAGYYPVYAEVTSPGYTGSTTGELIIAPATGTVTLGNLTQAYTGSPIYPSVTTVPANLGYSLTFNGSIAPAINPGTYTVVAAIQGTNYAGSATGTLTITGGTPATVALSNLIQTYTGSPLAATATTSPAGLTVALTYNGSATPPMAAGTYAVVATVTSAGYNGSATGSLIIANAPASITLNSNSLSQAYTGSPISASATTVPAGLAVGFTYNNSATPPTAPGSYAVIATITDPNYYGSTNGTLTITGAMAATVMLGNLAQTYSGLPISAATTTSPAGLNVSLTYNGSATPPTSAGTYAVVATVTSAGYSGSATGTLTIAKAPATVTLGGLSQAYSGSPIAVTATTAPVGLGVGITYNGSTMPPTATGNYTVVATVTDPNYTGTATGTLAITPAKTTPTVTVSPSPSSITTAQSLTVTIGVSGGSGNPTPTGSVTLSSGSYTSTATTLVSGNAMITVPAGSLATSTDTLTATYTPDSASSSTYNSATGTNSVMVTAATVQVTVGTSPAGLAFTVDGTSYASAQTLSWTVGSSHTIATTSPQTNGGTQNTFASWSDGGAISHSVTAPSIATNYTATFSTFYQLTTAANPSADGTVTPPSGTYYAAGTVVNLTATPNSSYTFTSWTGSVASSSSASTTITMSAPESVTANFSAVVVTAPVASLAPPSLSFTSTTSVASAAQAATLSNTGNATLTIASITIAGTNPTAFAVTTGTNACGASLAAGSTCSIYVTFTPASATSYAATLTVADNASGSPQTTSLTGTGTAAPSFIVSSTATAQTVQPGGAATYSITATAQNGTFPSPVTLAASGLPTGATASFSPTSITPGSTSGSSTLTIQTSAVATATPLKNPQWPLAAPVLALIGLFFLPGKKHRRWITLTLLLFATLGAFTALTACGGGFGLVRVIPPTSYTITVTGTSGAEQQTTTVQLTVQ
jgi:hypothetical protein